MPRAKRSQTTPPASSSAIPSKSHPNKKSDKAKSRSIDENHSTANLDDAFESPEEPLSRPFDGAVKTNRLTNSDPTSDCDSINQNCCYQDLTVDEASTTNEKNQKNLSNLSAMSEQPKELTIESAGGIDSATVDKLDKDEKELKKASQEINRSNRKLIKQTFNSNVLEIEAAGGVTEQATDDKAVNQDEDDCWDTL